MQWILRLFDKAGVFGAIVAAMGCASCFPALGSMAAALGLGFLAQFEGVFVNTLLPVFACVALLAQVMTFIRHRQWPRLLAGCVGPAMVLLTLYPLWTYDWSTYLFYAGLIIMFAVAVWDMVSPPIKHCTKEAQL